MAVKLETPHVIQNCTLPCMYMLIIDQLLTAAREDSPMYSDTQIAKRKEKEHRAAWKTLGDP